MAFLSSIEEGGADGTSESMGTKSASSGRRRLRMGLKGGEYQMMGMTRIERDAIVRIQARSSRENSGCKMSVTGDGRG
jgi:hypothetical protein